MRNLFHGVLYISVSDAWYAYISCYTLGKIRVMAL